MLGGSTGLSAVPPSGGELKPLTIADPSRQENGHFQPQFLPDARHYLYIAASAPAENSTIYVGLLGSREAKPIRKAYSKVSYASGYLIFANEGVLFAQPFDAGRLELSGDPVQIADQVGEDPIRPIPQFSTSEAGALAFVTGSAVTTTELRWIDRGGKPMGLAGPAGEYLQPRAFQRWKTGRVRAARHWRQPHQPPYLGARPGPRCSSATYV